MLRLFVSRTLWAVLALIAVAALAYGAGKTKADPAVPKVIRAQSFEMVDAHNHVRAHLRTDKDGTAQFELLNDRGLPQVSLNLTEENSPSVILLDDNNTIRAMLLVSPKDGAGLGLCNSQGIFRLGASVRPSNRAIIGLGDERTKGGSCLYSDENGATALELGSLQDKGARRLPSERARSAPRSLKRPWKSFVERASRLRQILMRWE